MAGESMSRRRYIRLGVTDRALLAAFLSGRTFAELGVEHLDPALARGARIEELLDQVFLRDPSDYRNVLRHLGRELQTTIDLEVLLARTIVGGAPVIALDEPLAGVDPSSAEVIRAEIARHGKAAVVFASAVSQDPFLAAVRVRDRRHDGRGGRRPG